jgi:hypothetical protein
LTGHTVIVTLYYKATLQSKATFIGKAAGGQTMRNQPNGEDISKYIDDIRTIKELLYGVEKRPLYERWVFWFWGGLVIAGTLIQHFLTARYPIELSELFLKIWLPIILLMGLSEVIALVQNLSRYSVSLFSRPYIKFYLGVVPSVAALVFLGVLFVRSGAGPEVPLVILLSGSIVFAFLAQHGGYSFVFMHSFVMFFLALILYFSHLPARILSLIVGLVLGVGIAVVGIFAKKPGKTNQ